MPDGSRAWPGAVNVVQRFGSSLALDVHFHLLVLDGAHVASRAWEPPSFHELEPLPEEAVRKMLATRAMPGIQTRHTLENRCGL